jgi:hypothetical protein
MTRFVLIRRDTGEPELVAETAIPTEAALHDALTDHPQLIPAADLGFGRTVVVGRESGLAGGYADLVLLDEQGRLAIVEIKKEGNPDTRRVVAQLLDYAAGLWGVSLDDFERKVLRPFLGDDPRTLHDFVRDSFSAMDASGEESDTAADAALRALEQGLSTGALTLVVAAPVIPAGVQRVLEYLNAQGLRLFGVEVSYFKGPAEAFVPRVVVRPSVADPAKTPLGGRPVLDMETFLPRLPEDVHNAVRTFRDRAAEHGGEVQWMPYGVRVKSAGGVKVLTTLDEANLWVALVPGRSLPTTPFDTARQALEAVGGGIAKKEWFAINWSKMSSGQFQRIVEICLELIQATTRPAPMDDE